MSSDSYDPDSAKHRLKDIADRFQLIKQFLKGVTREQFLSDTMRQYAVVRALEEACEAALWFDKHKNGEQIRTAYPNVNFRRFGNAGNRYRHEYHGVKYDVVWNDLYFGKDIAEMERLLEREVPFYHRQFGQENVHER